MDFLLSLIGLGGVILLVILSVYRPSRFIYYLLVIKPFIDVTVNQEFFGYNALALSGIYIFIFSIFYLTGTTKVKIYNLTPIFLYLGLQLFSIINGRSNYSRDLITMLELFIKMADAFLIYFIASKYMINPAERLKLYHAIWIVLNVVGVIYILSFLGGYSTTDETKGVMRYGGLYNDPGTPSYQSVIALIFAQLYLAIKKQNHLKITLFQKYNYLLTLTLLAIIFSLTITKSAMLMLVVFIIMYWGFFKRRTVIVIPLIIFGFYLAYNEFTEVSTRFTEEVSFLMEEDSTEDVVNSLGTGRVGRWIILWDMFKNDFTYIEKFIGTAEIYRAHNQFLAILLQVGFLGLFFFIIIIVRFFNRLSVLYRKTKFTELYFSITILVIFLFISNFGHPFYWTTILWYLMVMLSLVNVPLRNFFFETKNHIVDR